MSLFRLKLSLNSFWPIFGVPSALMNGRPTPLVHGGEVVVRALPATVTFGP